jgi:hypothetical protein
MCAPGAYRSRYLDTWIPGGGSAVGLKRVGQASNREASREEENHSFGNRVGASNPGVVQQEGWLLGGVWQEESTPGLKRAGSVTLTSCRARSARGTRLD